jgi:hypothetical protein
MERHELYELEQMREQLNLLNEKLDKQRIFNNKVLIDSANKSISKLNGSGKFYIFCGVFALLYCPFVFSNLGFSPEFVWGTVAMLAVCLGYTIYLHYGLRSIDMTHQNIVELSQKVLRLRKGYANWLYVGFSMIAVWFYFLYQEVVVIIDNPQGFLVAGVVGGLIGGIIGLTRHFKVVRDADELLEQIRDLQQM